MFFSEVARNNEADEGETGKDDEEDDNVASVRCKGGDAKKKDCKWHEVSQFSAIYVLLGATLLSELSP